MASCRHPILRATPDDPYAPSNRRCLARRTRGFRGVPDKARRSRTSNQKIGLRVQTGARAQRITINLDDGRTGFADVVLPTEKYAVARPVYETRTVHPSWREQIRFWLF